MQRRTINPPTVFNSLQYGFSQAMEVREGRRILLSGQVGVDADERTVGPGIAEQTATALDNIEKVLAAVEGDLSHVIMLRLYIVESARDQQEPIAAALRERFPRNPPPSSWIIVSGLSLPEWLIEIEAEALIPG
ncbi:translational inhibitor [Pseudomonas sp. FH4]|jgi:enamine deaminase RidA (YjgF/YER057c/UK114 family)|uniref:Enamine deaminase RidA, house cleaning of reactive enamine intermediates, YjgF/YER057c/UK114 family n=1 Tax=Pseudomonas brenneri TaxID=129817 RepID=A0A5B2UYQ6_9PSED|nr:MULTISPECIES: Rid family hydrolase [Pseudomonas]ETK13569.1 translational inhibitor [Pseudomonas sp. FH4]KAA2231956.1 RidA family protein [Pseudomonas brenneri]MBF8008151.1 RidA family protein [Pseudomonas brenneri]TWR79581.1 RidA family protein [Pseudomonas brenneri]WJM93486.1 Rid family hydrolase [Pseudomonas brenneri]